MQDHIISPYYTTTTPLLHHHCTHILTPTTTELHLCSTAPLCLPTVYQMPGAIQPFLSPKWQQSKPACSFCHTHFSRFSSQLKFSKDFSPTFTDFPGRSDRSSRNCLPLSFAEAQLRRRRLNASISCARLLSVEVGLGSKSCSFTHKDY